MRHRRTSERSTEAIIKKSTLGTTAHGGLRRTETGDARPFPALRAYPPGAKEPTSRVPYSPPRLERVGAWSALTLQQSVPIFP